MRRAMIVGAALGVAVAQPCSARAQGLIRLQPKGSAPAIVALPAQERSAVYVNYNDSEMAQRSWSVWVRYRGCAVTAHGAVRLAVYRAPGARAHLASFIQRVPVGARRYSRPVVAWKPSDSRLYTFTAPPKTTLYYRVAIPSRSGCASWSIGATTN